MTPFRIWAWPCLLAVLTLSGLVTALVWDSWGDAWSWFALGVPLIVVVCLPFRRKLK